MPFDIIGFLEATPGTGLVNLAAALGDDIYPAIGDSIKLKDKLHVIGTFCAAVSTGEDYRLRQPELRIDHQFIKIMLEADIDPAQGYEHLFGRPLPVKQDFLQALIQNATDESALIAVLLSDGPITQAMLDAVRPDYILKGEGDTTLTALTWTNVPITWDQDLPAGRYAIVGMRFGYWITTGALACLARLVLPSNTQTRPGIPGALMEADHEEFQSVTKLPFVDWPLMRDVWFDTNAYPNIECLSNAAITDENVELLLKKIG